MTDQKIIIPLIPQTLEQVKIHLLDNNPAQPTKRSETRALEGLKSRALATKFLSPIIAVRHGFRFTIVDGHRRKAVAEMLGVEELTTIVLEGVDPIKLFIDLGYGTKHFVGATWMTVWAKSDNRPERLATFSGDTRGKIKAMVDIFGEARTIQLGLIGDVSPGAALIIKKLLNQLVYYGHSPDKRTVGEWVLKYELQRSIEDQSRVGYKDAFCKKIMNWIRDDVGWNGKTLAEIESAKQERQNRRRRARK